MMQDNGNQQMLRVRPLTWSVCSVLGVALMWGMAAQAQTQDNQETAEEREARAEQEREAFDTDTMRDRYGIGSRGASAADMRSIEWLLGRAVRSQRLNPSVEGSNTGDSTFTARMVTDREPEDNEERLCDSSGGDWYADEQRCSFERQQCQSIQGEAITATWNAGARECDVEIDFPEPETAGGRCPGGAEPDDLGTISNWSLTGYGHADHGTGRVVGTAQRQEDACEVNFVFNEPTDGYIRTGDGAFAEKACPWGGTVRVFGGGEDHSFGSCHL